MDVYGFNVRPTFIYNMWFYSQMNYRMLGSLTFYRRILKDNVYSSPSVLAIPQTSIRKVDSANEQLDNKLPTIGHGLAGIMAGATVSFVAAPVEHIKARLQVQYAADKSKRLYSGPLDCIRKIVSDSYPERSCRQQQAYVDKTGSSPRIRRRIPWTLSHPPLSFILLLLVGFLRPFDPLLLRAHQSLHAFHQFLGRWSLRPSLLAYLLPIRRRQAANHDRSPRRCVKGRAKAFPKVEGRGHGDMATRWTKGLLEGVCAVFLESVSGECGGAGCI